MSGHKARPNVALCCGKDCRKDEGFAELRDVLYENCDVRRTRCLGPCKGPMVILDTESEEPTVLKSLSKGKHRRDLLAVLLEGRTLSERLVRRVVTGSKRRSALQKAAKKAPPM